MKRIALPIALAGLFAMLALPASAAPQDHRHHEDHRRPEHHRPDRDRGAWHQNGHRDNGWHRGWREHGRPEPFRRYRPVGRPTHREPWQANRWRTIERDRAAQRARAFQRAQAQRRERALRAARLRSVERSRAQRAQAFRNLQARRRAEALRRSRAQRIVVRNGHRYTVPPRGTYQQVYGPRKRH